jgi:hypothetical protein
VVARWFIFEPKIPIWVKFGGPWNGECGYMYFMIIFGLFFGHLVYQTYGRLV